MRRKLLSLLLVLAMAALALCGCGGGETQQEDEQPTPDAAQTEPPEETAQEQEDEPQQEENATEQEAFQLPILEENETFTYWTIYMPSSTLTYSNFNELPVAQELENLTNIHMDYIMTPAMNAVNNFNIMCASQDYADVMENVNSYYMSGATAALDDEVVLDHAPLVEEFMPNYERLIDSDESFRRDVTMDDGSMYGIFSIYSEDYPVPWGVMTRKDLAEKVGVDVNDLITYDDYHDLLTRFKVELGMTNALMLDSNGGMHNYFAAGFGVSGPSSDTNMNLQSYYVVDGEVLFGPTQEGYRDYLELMAQWYSEGLIGSDFIQMSDRTLSEAIILSDMCGVQVNRYINMNTFASRSDNPDFMMWPTRDPVQNEGDVTHLTEDYNRVSIYTWSISSTCRNPEAIAKWMDFWYSDQGIELTGYGFEGKTFNYVDGEPVFTELITDNPDGLNMEDALTQEVWNKTNGYVIWDRQMPIYTDNIRAAFEVWRETADNSWGYPTSATMTSDESVEYNALYADIALLVSEFTLGVISGSTDISEWDSFQETLSGMDVDRCVEIKQNAYDRYLSR